MQLYFIAATYTNNIYKRSDFYTGNNFNLNANKMLNINFRPDDGISSFITKHTTLPDNSSIWEYTHIIVPDYNKVYKISSIDYLNESQYNVIVDEDPLLSELPTLESTDIFLNRSNDTALFRGLNDIADQTIKETVEASMITPEIKTGKWALIFLQYNENAPTPTPTRMDIALNFAADLTPKTRWFDFESLTMAQLVIDYPEVATEEPELVDYYQKVAYIPSPVDEYYECVYRHDNSALQWVRVQETDVKKYYFSVGSERTSKINKTDVLTAVIALPFETSVFDQSFGPPNDKYLLSYQKFLGPDDSSQVLDIKIVNDLFIKQLTINETYTSATRDLKKIITYPSDAAITTPAYSDSGLSLTTNKRILVIKNLTTEIDISLNQGSITPLNAEPFYKYDLYVFGEKYKVPYYLTSNLKLLIAFNSGVINYIVYYNDRRNVIASGSFTHSIKYQVDQLDAFYSQNPSYKDAFYLKMATDAIRTAGVGLIGGVATGNPLAAFGGLAAAGVDAALAQKNLELQERGLRLKPDQIFGENSEVSLQIINVFGIYWVKRTSENIDLMKNEYYLRGFGTSMYKKINSLSFEVSVFGSSKVIYGELKKVIKNNYVTAFINEKLIQGIIIVS